MMTAAITGITPALCHGMKFREGIAGRADATALAREGHETFATAGIAAHAHEAVGEDAAAEVGAELALDEARDGAIPLAGAREEGLELRTHDVVEHARLALPLSGNLCPLGAAEPNAMVSRIIHEGISTDGLRKVKATCPPSSVGVIEPEGIL